VLFFPIKKNKFHRPIIDDGSYGANFHLPGFGQVTLFSVVFVSLLVCVASRTGFYPLVVDPCILVNLFNISNNTFYYLHPITSVALGFFKDYGSKV
jgi:hypothetical protein